MDQNSFDLMLKEALQARENIPLPAGLKASLRASIDQAAYESQRAAVRKVTSFSLSLTFHQFARYGKRLGSYLTGRPTFVLGFVICSVVASVLFAVKMSKEKRREDIVTISHSTWPEAAGAHGRTPVPIAVPKPALPESRGVSPVTLLPAEVRRTNARNFHVSSLPYPSTAFSMSERSHVMTSQHSPMFFLKDFSKIRTKKPSSDEVSVLDSMSPALLASLADAQADDEQRLQAFRKAFSSLPIN